MAGEIKTDAREDRLQGPMRALHKEREHVRKQMLKDARDQCHETRAAYVECAKGRTLSLPFMCRSDFKAFNACLSQYSSEEELERRVAEYKATRMQPEGASPPPVAQVRPSDLIVSNRPG